MAETSPVNPLVRYMQAHDIPLTQENYIALDQPPKQDETDDIEPFAEELLLPPEISSDDSDPATANPASE